MKLKISMLLLGLATLLSSCDPSGLKDESKTSYTVNYKIDTSDIWAELPGATHDESIAIFEYNDVGECVNTQNFDNVHYGSSKTFTAHYLATKLAVYFEIEVEYNGKEVEQNYWLQQVFYLEPGKNITITITDESRVGSTKPIK